MITLLVGLVLSSLGVVLIVAYELIAAYGSTSLPTISALVWHWRDQAPVHRYLICGLTVLLVAGVVTLAEHFLGGF